ncbi:NIF-domain-containing protein, partial [Aulographum hederae CBS 113979]
EDYSKTQPEFDSPAKPEANTTPNPQPSESPEARPLEPLPDLRFGIPSTFAAEFGKQETQPQSDAKPTPESLRDDQHGINITEDQNAEQPTPGGSGGRGGGELPKSAYETSTDRRRNQFANYMYAASALFGTVGVIYLGRNWETAEEEKSHIDAPSGFDFKQFYNRAKARISEMGGYYTEPTFPKLLPDVDPAPPYTLVLSMEDLMIHSEWTRKDGWRMAKRPGLDYFLRYLSQYYELVIFTSLPSTQADPVIRKLDPFRIIMWPLFREATRYERGEYVKDLSYLNRDLSKTIIIDTKAAHVSKQPENAIVLPPWKGDPKDRDLVALIPFLEHIATVGKPDVRPVLESFKDKHIPTEFSRREALARDSFYRNLAEEQKTRPKRSGLGFLSKGLGLKEEKKLMSDGSVIDIEAEKGKWFGDLVRERGQKQYEMLEREIRTNGEKWLKEMADEEKKAQEEQMRSMKQGMFGYFG